jgi:hypothetical protein
MIKRVTWFLGGVAAGAAGAGIAKKKVKAAAVEFAPANVARKATHRIRDALHEGRQAMHAKEAELKGRVDGRVRTLADDLDEGDAVLVDGVPVAPGQVIVLKQVRDAQAQSGRRRNRA